jgi:hypothetical protein
MIGVFVTFRYGDNFDEQAVRKIADTVVLTHLPPPYSVVSSARSYTCRTSRPVSYVMQTERSMLKGRQRRKACFEPQWPLAIY